MLASCLLMETSFSEFGPVFCTRSPSIWRAEFVAFAPAPPSCGSSLYVGGYVSHGNSKRTYAHRRPFSGGNALVPRICRAEAAAAASQHAAHTTTRCCASRGGAAHDADDAAEAAAPLDGEIRELFEAGIRAQNLSADDLREADRRVLDGITDSGRMELRAIADDVFASLDDISRVSNDRAEQVLENELQVTLDEFDKRRKELIANAVAERNNIRTEAERIKVLAASLSDKRTSSGQPYLFGSQDLLFAIAALLGLATLYYAWQAIVDSSENALYNALIDCAMAAGATVMYRKGSEPRGK